MATISYKCDTCKREIELLENIQGLTVYGKCVITNGCLGKLKSTSRNQNNIRESLPSYDSYDNYYKRNIFHEHVQVIKNKVWNVVHNLNCSPSISIFVDSDSGDIQEMNQDDYIVTIIDADTSKIEFSDKQSGVLHAISRSGSPIKPKVLVEDAQLFQITNTSNLTLSIPKYKTDGLIVTEYTGDIHIEVEIIKPNEEPLFCFETFPDQLTTKSPWYNWFYILMRKRRLYKIRNKSILEFRTFKYQTIPDGTLIKFKKIDFGDGIFKDIESKTLLFMLAQTPFTTYDKIKNKICDVGELLNTEFDYFVYNNGDLFTKDTNIEKTYPDVEKA